MGWVGMLNLKIKYFSFSKKRKKNHLNLSYYLPHTHKLVCIFCISPYASHESFLYYKLQNQKEVNVNKKIHFFLNFFLVLNILIIQGTLWPLQSLPWLVMCSCQGIAVSLTNTAIIAHLGFHLPVQAAECDTNGILGCIIMCFQTPLGRKGWCCGRIN